MHDVTMRKKAMISQPMNGLTDEEIEKTRNKAIRHLDRLGYKVVNTLFKDGWYNNSAMKDRGVMNIPVYYLARSLESMSFCDVVYFCDGWEMLGGAESSTKQRKPTGSTLSMKKMKRSPKLY